MQTLNWLESHIGSLDDGIQVLNRYYWFLTVVENKSHTYWYVQSGEKTIFSADSREAVDAFLYGMSLAYNGIPEPLFDELIEKSKAWFE